MASQALVVQSSPQELPAQRRVVVKAEARPVELGMGLALPQAVVVDARGLALEQASELPVPVPPIVVLQAAWAVAQVSDSGCQTRSHGGVKRQPHLSTSG